MDIPLVHQLFCQGHSWEKPERRQSFFPVQAGQGEPGVHHHIIAHGHRFGHDVQPDVTKIDSCRKNAFVGVNR